MPSKINFQLPKEFLRACYRDFRENLFGQTFPLKPQVLNLLVNDICNSRCRMCNIWRRKKDMEISPAELSFILRDRLFSSVSHVGVSGGEPTLRKDLPEICQAVIQSCPGLKSLGVITNAINRKDVIRGIEAVSSVCGASGVPFNIMVSMDGIGAVHDRIRGRKGNFESAIAVIRYFKDKTIIPVTVGCTIVRENVWHVDDILDYCIDNGIYIRFRVAEFIRRLYNERLTGSIRNFSPLESYHLGLFFFRLEYSYETSPAIKRSYRNIRRMLMASAGRECGCIFANKALTLDCRGRLLYCAPRSPELGDCRKIPAIKLYRDNMGIRRKIVENDCAGCIHDYTGERNIREVRREFGKRLWRKILSLDTSLMLTRGYRHYPGGKKSVRQPSRFLIIGWYGTETAGDKAILAGIVHEIKSRYPGSSIVLSTLHPDYSRMTIKEPGCSGISLVPVYSYGFFKAVAGCDEVIMGGGPLMHIDELGLVLSAFFRAKKTGKKTWIAGCGIGPLDRGPGYAEAVKRILALSDRIELRDAASARWAREKTGRTDITVSGDYARAHVLRRARRGKTGEKRPCLNLYLRDFTSEYKGGLTDKEFFFQKERFESQLGSMIHAICRGSALRPRLLSMHHFVIGGDDRVFNRRFSRQYLADLNPVTEIQPFTVDEILESMRTAVFSICMRFHSVLFAHTLGVPFIAIDYTRGGKIFQYLSDNDRLQALLSMDSIARGEWRGEIGSVPQPGV
ncbi:MAG: radical SAM protein [Deltaproteobacteria bacterium]|nr:radical SAM protein [Deltaproteobacteria bacterium]